MGTTMEDLPALAMEDGCLDLPPGFRFHPTDEEIITHYLVEKAINKGFSARAVGEVDLNRIEPWDLPSKAKMGEKEWYFFCQKDRKYPTGMRTNRATEAGYWKATGKDKEIYKGKNFLVGMKKTLVFYKGRAPKGEKTNWVMHEYRLEGKSTYPNLPKSAKDAWVVCRVFHKNTGAKKSLSPSAEPSGRNDLFGVIRTSSFEEDEYLPSSPLPPLTDSPYGRLACFMDDGDGGDFKTGAPSASSPNPFYFPSVESLQDLQNYILQGGGNITTCPNNNLQAQANLQISPPQGSMFHPDQSTALPSSSHSLQSSPNMGYNLQHATLRAQSAPQEELREGALMRRSQQYNVEQHSINQSMVISASQDTGLSADRNNTEISSVVSNHGVGGSRSHDVDADCPSSSATYLQDSLWKC